MKEYFKSLLIFIGIMMISVFGVSVVLLIIDGAQWLSKNYPNVFYVVASTICFIIASSVFHMFRMSEERWKKAIGKWQKYEDKI